MCGIVGIIDKNGRTSRQHLLRMRGKLAHRGSDDSGEYTSPDGTVLFGHQRLSIIDVSSSGHQPMINDGCVLIYNGEIYNFEEIKAALVSENVHCTSGSDSEVLLRAWQLWGEKAIQRFRGMFAFAIYDTRAQAVHVYRDRLGVKPLYYYHANGVFAFASEIKALLEHPAVRKEINFDALGLFFQLGYIPAPQSIFKHIYKLKPGHSLTISANLTIRIKPYWSMPLLVEKRDTFESEATVISQLKQLISESCELRMIADVPVGVFLSGGIDSTLVTAILRENGHHNISTFTVGFDDDAYDESSHARTIATYLGTSHHELMCSPNDAIDIVPLLASVYDEPFADPSAIPTYLLARFAHTKVKAALSADGGDELFGGYRRYVKTKELYEKFGNLPVPSKLLQLLPAHTIEQLAIHPGFRKFQLMAKIMKERGDLPGTYSILRSYFSEYEVQHLLQQEVTCSVSDVFASFDFSGDSAEVIERLQHIDVHTYLPDDILVKVDRASMAHGLESREPLLDHRLVEYVQQIPYGIKHAIPGEKYLLRTLLQQYVPREFFDRPKKGFGVPLDTWLRGGLAPYVDEYLSPERLQNDNVLSSNAVLREVHLFKNHGHSANRIWNLLVFQMWRERWNV